jgi:hypothetical protein
LMSLMFWVMLMRIKQLSVGLRGTTWTVFLVECGEICTSHPTPVHCSCTLEVGHSVSVDLSGMTEPARYVAAVRLLCGGLCDTSYPILIRPSPNLVHYCCTLEVQSLHQNTKMLVMTKAGGGVKAKKGKTRLSLCCWLLLLLVTRNRANGLAQCRKPMPAGRENSDGHRTLRQHCYVGQARTALASCNFKLHKQTYQTP